MTTIKNMIHSLLSIEICWHNIHIYKLICLQPNSFEMGFWSCFVGQRPNDVRVCGFQFKPAEIIFILGWARSYCWKHHFYWGSKSIQIIFQTVDHISQKCLWQHSFILLTHCGQGSFQSKFFPFKLRNSHCLLFRNPVKSFLRERFIFSYCFSLSTYNLYNRLFIRNSIVWSPKN